MELCGAEAPALAPAGQALDAKTSTLETGIRELHLKQDSIDRQLQRLEQSLLALQRSVSSAPPVQAQPAPSPKVEIRTVLKSEPLSWYVLLGIVGAIVAAAVGGFAYVRRGSFTRGLTETDEQLDRMLATAATVMREMETTPKPAPAHRLATPPKTPSPTTAPPQPAEPRLPAASPAPAVPTAEAPAASGLGLKPESEPPAQPQVAGLSNELLFEMDQALDNTRSMFTDVDRFIALGRTQNALSLLQFQVHKDPRDRDSWIKLMAIYRQEKLDAELAKAAREFRSHFPNEYPPAV